MAGDDRHIQWVKQRLVNDLAGWHERNTIGARLEIKVATRIEGSQVRYVPERLCCLRTRAATEIISDARAAPCVDLTHESGSTSVDIMSLKRSSDPALARV